MCERGCSTLKCLRGKVKRSDLSASGCRGANLEDCRRFRRPSVLPCDRAISLPLTGSRHPATKTSDALSLKLIPARLCHTSARRLTNFPTSFEPSWQHNKVLHLLPVEIKPAQCPATHSIDDVHNAELPAMVAPGIETNTCWDGSIFALFFLLTRGRTRTLQSRGAALNAINNSPSGPAHYYYNCCISFF